MRFYDIIIKGKDGKLLRSTSLSGAAVSNFRAPSLFGIQLPKSVATPSVGTKQQSTFTSYINGQTLPGALNIEVNIPQYTAALPANASITIHGISKEEISAAWDLANCQITMYAGMKKGLPLAQPGQSVLPLIKGIILQAFGNWQGAQQSLTLMIQPGNGIGRAGDNKNFSFILKANASIKDAIITTMKAAMPSAKVSVFVSDEIKFDDEKAGTWGSLAAFAQALQQLTQRQVFQGIKTINGNKYGGIEVIIMPNSGDIIFTDRTVALQGGKEIKVGGSGAKQISFSDIIGQPTWQAIGQINFKTVMRSDLAIGDVISLPQAIFANSILTANSAPPIGNPNNAQGDARNKSTFKGNFIIASIRHLGNFRGTTGDDWVTNIVAVIQAPEEKIPEGKVIVGQPTKVTEQQSVVVNPTPPNAPTPTPPADPTNPGNPTPASPPDPTNPGQQSSVTGASVPTTGSFVERAA